MHRKEDLGGSPPFCSVAVASCFARKCQKATWQLYFTTKKNLAHQKSITWLELMYVISEILTTRVVLAARCFFLNNRKQPPNAVYDPVSWWLWTKALTDSSSHLQINAANMMLVSKCKDMLIGQQWYSDWKWQLQFTTWLVKRISCSIICCILVC